MDLLLPVVNVLEDAFLTARTPFDIDFPQIAVVGAQSVGKSSVLESLVGREFLPRGTGIVTRRPLILQLRRVSHDKDFGEFEHRKGTKFFDFEEIRREIEAETNRVAGDNKRISSDPIMLKIFSSRVVDLTLVDLPGITKNPIEDQPVDIESQVHDLILSYISGANCIILAVTAANTDLANSDSLKIARSVDPNGERTIGVVTKCDLIEEGSDCLDFLKGRAYPLRRGYVGVVCRSVREAQGKKFGDWTQAEMKFFKENPIFKDIRHRAGVKFLGKMLSQVLFAHIRSMLPTLKTKIHTYIIETERELSGYDMLHLETDEGRRLLLLQYCDQFSRSYQDIIEGRSQSLVSTDSLTGGARIHFVFNDWYTRTLLEFNPMEKVKDDKIRTMIRNVNGPNPRMFLPEAAFENLLRRLIEQLEAPSLQCMEQVYLELLRIIEKCSLPSSDRFPRLREKMLEVVRGVLKGCLSPTERMIRNIIDIELAYINISHPEFLIEVKKISNGDWRGFGFLANAKLQPQAQASASASEGVSPTSPSVLNNYPPASARTSNFTNQSKAAPQGPPPFHPSNSNSHPNTRLMPLMSNMPEPHGGIFGLLRGSRTSAMGSETSSAFPAPPSAPNSLSTSSGHPPANSALPASLPPSTNAKALSQLRDMSSSGDSDISGCLLSPFPQDILVSDDPNEREQVEVFILRMLVEAYFRIVKKTIADLIPKSIMHFLVYSSRDFMRVDLTSALTKDESLSILMQEPEEILHDREYHLSMLKRFQEALDKLRSVQEYSAFE